MLVWRFVFCTIILALAADHYGGGIFRHKFAMAFSMKMQAVCARAVTSDCCSLDQCGDLCLGYHDHVVILELYDNDAGHDDAGVQKLDADLFCIKN